MESRVKDLGYGACTYPNFLGTIINRDVKFNESTILINEKEIIESLKDYSVSKQVKLEVKVSYKVHERTTV